MASKNNYDLEAMTVQELTTLISDAEGKRREKMDDAKAALLGEMEEKAAALGLSLKGLIQGSTAHTPATTSSGRKPRKDAGTPVAAKFRGPDGQEWSGRGRPPTWLVALEAEGKNREDFRI